MQIIRAEELQENNFGPVASSSNAASCNPDTNELEDN
jgi:hypothetical protein